MLIQQGQTDHKTAIEIKSNADKETRQRDKQADRQDILKRGKGQEKKKKISWMQEVATIH